MKSNVKLQITLENLLSSVSDDYYLYYYEENFKSSSWTNLSAKDKIIEDTIKKYKSHYEDFEVKRIAPLFEYFQKTIQYNKNNALLTD